MKRTCIALMAVAALLTGCNQNGSQGGTGGNDTRPVTGRGSGQSTNSGGTGKVYDRGGAPGSVDPGRQQPGSGRIDQGGGATAGGPIDNSVPSAAESGATNPPPGAK